jgi:hypothetical protein
MSYNSVFLDSGAFSASRKGEPIKVDDYIQFIKENEESFDIYANLDVIGDWKATWANQIKMEKAGLSPLPVHHLEDPDECLNWCLEYDYFALGGVAGGLGKQDRERFFDKCWGKIVDENGYPKSKVHGFGVASPELIKKYPWYSIDTSSWVAYGRYGIVVMPRYFSGKLDYFKPPVKLFVTKESPRRSEEGKHVDNLTTIEKERFMEYLNTLDLPFGDGKTKGVSNDNFYRDLCNYLFFVNMAKDLPEYPWAWKKKNHLTLF